MSQKGALEELGPTNSPRGQMQLGESLIVHQLFGAGSVVPRRTSRGAEDTVSHTVTALRAVEVAVVSIQGSADDQLLQLVSCFPSAKERVLVLANFGIERSLAGTKLVRIIVDLAFVWMTGVRGAGQTVDSADTQAVEEVEISNSLA